MELLLHNNTAEALPSMVDHHSKATAHLLSNNTEDSSSKGMGDHRQDHPLDKARVGIRVDMVHLRQLRDTEVFNPYRETRVIQKLIRC